MLKPGPNGWDKYCELVAAAYARAPKFDENAVSSFEAMKPFVDKMFKRIEGVVDVEFVEEHPYANAEELKQDVKQNGVLRISTLDAECRESSSIETSALGWRKHQVIIMDGRKAVCGYPRRNRTNNKSEP